MSTEPLNPDEANPTPLEGTDDSIESAPETEAGAEDVSEPAEVADSEPADAVPALQAETAAPAAASDMKWYVVKVQSGREESIKDAIERRVKIEGLQDCFGEILIPVEKVTEMGRNNKRVIKHRKLYPGYLMVHLEFNDRMLYLFRETSGVGDFVGGGLNKPPPPMPEREVEKLRQMHDQVTKEVPVKSKFDRGDRVKVKDGTFAGMEGEVKEVLEAKGALKVELTIFGRPVPVELEYWQVDAP